MHAVTNSTKFTEIDNTSSQSNFDYLRGRRVFTELRKIERSAHKTTAVKSLIAVILLAISIATVALFYANSFLLGTGIGLIVLSAYAITYYRHQFKENNHLFRQAKSALNRRY